MVELPGKDGAFAAHEDVEEHPVEQIEDKREDKFNPGLVFLVPKHPDDGKKKGDDGDGGGTQEDVDCAHGPP